MPKRILEEFRLDKIAVVDRPCQQGARMTIMKRANTLDTEQFAPIFKAWMDPANGAKPFSEFLENSLSLERYYKIVDEVGPVLTALNNTLYSIAGDSSVNDMSKMSAMREAVESFMSEVRTKWPDVSAEVAKAASSFASKNNEGDTHMPADIKDLEKQVADLTKSLADLQVERDVAVAKAAEAEAIAKLTPDERDAMKAMDEAGRKAFMAMTPEERAKKMKKAAEADESFEINGSVVRKSAVGEEAFSMMKAMRAEQEALRKGQQEAQAAVETARFEKMAQDKFSHLPGSVEERGAMLKAVEAIKDEAVRKTFDALFTAHEALAKKAFAMAGISTGGIVVDQDVKNQFLGKVSEISKRDDITRADAMVKAATEYPDLYKAFSGNPNQGAQ